MDVFVREIAFGSDEYRAALRLRSDVLREPLGLVLGGADTDNDANELQLGAFLGETLVGVLLLRLNSPTEAQMRQVAVDPTIHGKGIGRKLVEAFERAAKQKGASDIVMNARVTAQAFYEKLGYTTYSDAYIQSTIPHIKMRKSI